MERTFWQKQTDKPLFEDLLWSRPEQRSLAGKLLIVGGNLHAFAAPAEAFGEAGKAGVGVARVLLPNATKKLVGPLLEAVEYAPSTPSGSFSQQALAEVLDASRWTDAVLLAGDLGRNSETAILLEKLTQKYRGQLTLTKDAVDYATTTPDLVRHRPDTLLVLSVAQLQKLAVKAGFTQAFTFDMDLLRFVDTLYAFTAIYPVHIIVKHLDTLHVASNGKVITTKVSGGADVWRVRVAAHAAVWWLQNPEKVLEGLATAVFETRL